MCFKEELTNWVGDYQEAYWNLKTVNLGLSGASSIDLLKRFRDLVLSQKPQMIFLRSSEGNDADYNIDVKTTKENTKKIISKALTRDIKIVFSTPAPSLWNYLNKKQSAYIKADRELAKKFLRNKNFIFVDLMKLFPKNLIKQSYTLISEEIKVAGIKEGGALTRPIIINSATPLLPKFYLKKFLISILMRRSFCAT